MDQDISLTMVLIMMNLHSRSINIRFKSLKRVIQIRHRIGVGNGGNGDGSCQSGCFLEEFTAGISSFCNYVVMMKNVSDVRVMGVVRKMMLPKLMGQKVCGRTYEPSYPRRKQRPILQGWRIERGRAWPWLLLFRFVLLGDDLLCSLAVLADVGMMEKDW
jgi:hypothetical protein